MPGFPVVRSDSNMVHATCYGTQRAFQRELDERGIGYGSDRIGSLPRWGANRSLAAQAGDDSLAGLAVQAIRLHQAQVGVMTGLVGAQEHGRLGTLESYCTISNK